MRKHGLFFTLKCALMKEQRLHLFTARVGGNEMTGRRGSHFLLFQMDKKKQTFHNSCIYVEIFDEIEPAVNLI